MTSEMNIIEEFIAYLKEQVLNHSIYVWGAQGQQGKKITEKWIISREKKNGEVQIQRALNFWQKQVKKGYGDVMRAFDCSGLICFFWQNTKHVLKWDHNAHGLMNKCKIVTDRKPGYLVFRVSNGRATHVGALIDKNTVIHAKGRDVGVVQEPYKASYWHRIGQPKFVDSELFNTPTEPSTNPIQPTEPTPVNPPSDGFVFTRNMKKGMKGNDVVELKKLLIAAGYSEGITTNTSSSTHYGRATRALVKKYQKDHDLEVDGIAGSHTINSLGGIYK